ncbi:transcriptional regulator with XRE-family HTH domain [Spinactinospora alkalitolerans]|uniref:Transcriptional regulator with XRE-family HTH domain n=1 Tax=Spinactinospora alkalitolerans TaxID=687207 RepID=A0A852U565_9ACTN|nr:helix-turn-helix transcriptional regulator [Spinactinospora alkalitolerans]NYE50033.1 transcriptional regulator with XRE-family HTH domain [Spinactinospora alkalitolerans]
MPPIQAPTIRLRQLGMELRKWREHAEVKLEEAAAHLECSTTRVSRIELAKAKPRIRDVRDLCELYEVPEHLRAQLIQLARDAQTPGWWTEYEDVLSAEFGSYMGMEHEAASLRAYEAQLVHGLLQTSAYARAVLHETSLGLAEDDEELQRRLALRLKRQQLLDRTTPPFRLGLVLDEAVIRRPVGGTAVMRDQLTHLLEAGERPNITLQVLPFAKGAHAALDGPFYLIGFPAPTHPDVVYVESQGGNAYLEKPDQVERHTRMFELLTSDALSREDTRAFLHRAIKELR